jgi:hypothetical protein
MWHTVDWDYMTPCPSLQVVNHSPTVAPSAPKETHFFIHDPPSSSGQTARNAALVASKTPGMDKKKKKSIYYKINYISITNND